MHPDSTVHHFTIDVEEYFQVSAFESLMPLSKWAGMESRVERSMDRMAELLALHDAKATLFILGWVAERHPAMVKRLAAAGHEIASHGYDHRRVTTITPEDFRVSVRRTKQLLEDMTGCTVHGFRAPSFSIVRGREWALEILKEEQYAYDSSLYPIRRKGYGYPGGQRDPHVLGTAAGPLIEVPPATIRAPGLNLPAGGGAYFRLFPYAVTRAAFTAAERRGVPATFYIHPWEIDPDQPRLDVSRLTVVRHYGGMKRAEGRVQKLLRDYRFQTIQRTLQLPA